MKTAIIYTSKHGTTEKVARKIEQNLANDFVDVFEIRKVGKNSLESYDKIIIGGSIHAGGIQRSVSKFVQEKQAVLSTKLLGLYVCGMEPNKEKQQTELENAYPETLRKQAKAVLFAGGEFIFEKMNFLEKMIVKKVAKTDKSVSAIDESAILDFINQMK